MMLKLKSNSRKNILTLIIGIMVLVSDDSLLFGTNNNNRFILFKYAILFFVFIYLFYKTANMKFKTKKNKFALLGIMIAIILSSLMFNMDIRGGYFQKTFIILLVFMCSNLYPSKSISKTYTRIIYVVTIISLVYEIMYIVFPSAINQIQITNSGGIKFYTCFFASLPVEPGGILRNYGFAREPGVYSVFLIIALIMETYFNDDTSIKKILIFIAGLLSTLSTTAYIAFAFYLLSLFFFMKKITFKYKMQFLFLLLFIAVSFIYVLTQTDFLFGKQYGSIFGKLNSGAIDNSYGSRLASIITNLNIGSSSPFFGRGISYVENNFSSITFSLLNNVTQHNANTWFIHFAQFGLIFCVVQLYGLYLTVSSMTKQKIVVYLCIISIVIVEMGQTMAMSPIFYLLLFLWNGGSKIYYD